MNVAAESVDDENDDKGLIGMKKEMQTYMPQSENYVKMF